MSCALALAALAGNPEARACPTNAGASCANPVAEGIRFGEGPVLRDDGTRYWVEAYAHKIMMQRPGDEPRTLEAEVALPAGLAVAADGRVLVAEFGGGRVSWVDPETGETGVLVDSHGGRPLNGPNDLIVAPDGGVWFTDPALLSANTQRDQQVFYLPPEGALVRAAGRLRVPNGLALLPDGSALIVAEWGAGRIWRYPVEGPGQLEEPTRFTRARTPTPDGMCVHTPSGRIFVASGPDLMVFDLDGERLATVKIPGDPTNCAIAGDRMLVTTRKRVYEIDVP